MIRLVGGVQVDHPGAVARRLQHGHLVDDVGPAVATSPPLSQELGGEHFARGLLHTALHHRELPPAEETESGACGLKTTVNQTLVKPFLEQQQQSKKHKKGAGFIL